MSEPTPREIRQGIADKLAGLPAGVDHDGHHDLDRAADAATIASVMAPEPVADPEPPVVQAPMKPNPLQGHSAAGSRPATPPDSTLDRIRAQASKHNTTGV